MAARTPTTLAIAMALPVLAAGAAVAAVPTKAAPVHDLAVAGAGLGMYPAFDAEIERYAVTATNSATGEMAVTATTSDPSGSVWINGRRASAATSTLTGLVAGDEVSVIIKDAGGTKRHSLYYLPAGFPTYETPVTSPGLAPGHIFLTPSKWQFFAPQFEAIVDRRGVPIYTSDPAGSNSTNLKRQANGRYSVMRATTTPGRTGHMLVELDRQMRQIRTWETVGLTNTDLHDGLLLANGNALLIAYDTDQVTGLIDAVIQEVTSAGKVVFQWNSRPLLAEAMIPGSLDYAHIDSVAISRNGKDIIASFAGLNSVLRIARFAHDGFRPGDIVWRLGGRASDFEFVGDPFPGGPCTQYTASELPGGNILLYDSGSDDPARCTDPTAPATAPAISRPSTRVTEYALDQGAGTARLAWSYDPGRYGIFGGSAQRLANGNTMVGWANGADGVAEEVSASGEVLWRLKDKNSTQEGYNTNRAYLFAAPDAIKPVVTPISPAVGQAIAFGSAATIDFSCTDKGGSSLATCGADGQWGSAINTSWPGPRTLIVKATDGAGNASTAKVDYVIARPDHLVDLAIRPSTSSAYTGSQTTTPPQSISQVLSRVGASVTAYVRLSNAGASAEPVAVTGTAGTAAVRVRYFAGTNDVTAAVVGGSYQSASLAPGGSAVLRVVATRLAPATAGSSLQLTVTGSAGGVSDTVTDRISIG